jgi:D-alanyl-lipoteichoic acid acyltransferase DltB (MBOAT superfamily)
MRNFNYPYFSRNIAEFWKRWHISLTTWFRDYVFLPLSFSVSWRIKNERVLFMKSDLFIYVTASLVTWFLTGLWHGANYTFIIWGMIHGSFLIAYQLQKRPRKKLFKKFKINNNSWIIIVLETLITLVIIMIAWVVFRADNVPQALAYLSKLFSPSILSMPEVFSIKMVILIAILITLEWMQRDKEHAMQIGSVKSGFVRWGLYFGVIMVILFFGGEQQDFIYFQF